MSTRVPDKDSTIKFAKEYWRDSIIPSLSDFIRIPCKSVNFDTDWQQTKYLEQAAHLMGDWAKNQNFPGLTYEVVKLKDYPPALYIDIPGQTDDTILFYGHIDKMPESEGWDAGLGAWQPVLKGDKLYGRGAVDDGYVPYMAIAALKILHEQKIAYPRCVILMEGAEESGSPHFIDYLEHLKNRIGKPSLIAIADADAEKEYLVNTLSIRGLISGTLSVEIAKNGIHSGMASGAVPSTFRILRQLLDRIEDKDTGEILLKSAHVKIPPIYVEKAKAAAAIFGDKFYKDFGLLDGCQPVNKDLLENILATTWRPTLSIIGAEGLPQIKDAGNALRPFTKLRLSIRIPPGADPVAIASEAKQKLEANPPYGAHVSIDFGDLSGAAGWSSSEQQAIVFDKLLREAAKPYYAKGVLSLGCGGGIGPVLPLAKTFNGAQIWVMGLIMSDSGTHGPNEFLHIPSAEKLTCCLADMMVRYFNNEQK